MTFLQTDTDITGAQSVGALVTGEGEVIGVSGVISSDGTFGLAVSAADALPRVERLIAGEDVAGLGDRSIPLEGGQFEHRVILSSDFEIFAYVLNEPVGTRVDIVLESSNDIGFLFFEVSGNPLMFADETFTGIESASGTTAVDAPHFLVFGQSSEGPGEVRVSSSHRLAPYEDVERWHGYKRWGHSPGKRRPPV